MVHPDETEQLLDKYREILAQRSRRYSSDSLFANRKREFEKVLLERLGNERHPEQAAALVEMYAQLASFVPDADVAVAESCRRRAEQDKEFQAVLDMMERGEHEAVQKELEAKKIPELTRYYALHRRVLLEYSARRQQAQSVQALHDDQSPGGAQTDA